MLHGVFFKANLDGTIDPHFVNRYVQTDVHLAFAHRHLSSPVLPSISTLFGSVSQLPTVTLSILRSVSLIASTFLRQFSVRRISVSNTSVLWHDGRALVGCESGPLNWIRLPALETVGWWDLGDSNGHMGLRKKHGRLGWMKEWTTAHVGAGELSSNELAHRVSIAEERSRHRRTHIISFHHPATVPYLLRDSA